LKFILSQADKDLLNITQAEGDPNVVDLLKKLSRPDLLKIALQNSTQDNLRVLLNAFGASDLPENEEGPEN